MGSSRFSLKRSLLLSTVVFLTVFSAAALAQNTGNNGGNNGGGLGGNTGGNNGGNTGDTGGATNNGNGNGGQQTSPTDNNNPPAQTTQATDHTTEQATQQTNPQTNQQTIQQQTTQQTPSQTGKTPQLSLLPSLTTPTTANGPVTGLPKLTNTPTIISYPPPSVPPTNDAPFMQRSSLPDGTVFIAVGAILGAFGVGLLVWRAIIACLLHRSVERAAAAQTLANDKATFPGPPPAFYTYNDRESSPSLAGGAGRGIRRTNRGPTPSATPSQSNLFFSPTAGSTTSMGANRDSRFLPSGFYAAGAQSPAPGHSHSISLTNLRPESVVGYGANSRNTMREPSPPDSPQMGARREVSNTSLNLNRPPSGRAPSAFLDDLLDENPHMFPPQGSMPPPGVGRHQHSNSYSSSGRF